MQIYYSGQITKKEYSSAIKIHFNQQFKWVKLIFGAVLIIILFSLLITGTRQPSILKVLFPGILFPFIFLTFPWWTPLLQTTSYDKNGNIYRIPIRGVIDDTGITINGQDVKSSFVWNAYTHFRKIDGLIMVYQGKNCFNIFTKNMFGTQEEWNQFEDFLKRKTPSR